MTRSFVVNVKGQRVAKLVRPGQDIRAAGTGISNKPCGDMQRTLEAIAYLLHELGKVDDCVYRLKVSGQN